MSTDLTVYQHYRPILDTFMIDGSGSDNWVNGLEAIDCNIAYTGGLPVKKCIGILIGSTTAQSGLGGIRVMGFGGTLIATLNLALGIWHPLCPRYLFTGSARDVVLGY